MPSSEAQAMELLEAPKDLLSFLFGLFSGGAISWLVGGWVFRWRAGRLQREAVEVALSQSRRVLKGQAAEQLAPLSGAFPYLPSDARFLGSPIDYLVFDGLSDEKDPVEIVFVEVKSGKARLNAREARVREAVQAGRVRWHELRLP